MHVLMISLDETVFPDRSGTGNTIQRMNLYLEALQKAFPESSITSLVFTRKPLKPFSPSKGLQFIPFHAPLIPIFPFSGFLQVLRLRRLLHPDIVTAQTPFETGLLGWLIALLYKIPLEVQIHLNLFSAYWLEEHRIFNKIRLWIARFILKRASVIRVVSTQLKENLIHQWKTPASKIIVIPVPVIKGELSPNLSGITVLTDPNTQIVLFVGRLCKAKNLPGLFKIIKKVLAEKESVDFVLIGDGPQGSYAEQSAASLASDRIHVLGKIPYDDLQGWYEKAYLLVLPSYHEGFARVLVEAYLCATPVVATRCGGPQDIIIDRETGFLTEIEDMDSFAGRVLWLLDHPDLAEVMGQKGYSYVTQKFEPRVLVQAIVENWFRLGQRET